MKMRKGAQHDSCHVIQVAAAMAVDREFVNIVFDSDGPRGPPWGLHGAPMGAPWGPMGTTWASNGTPQGPRAKLIDFP